MHFHPDHPMQEPPHFDDDEEITMTMRQPLRGASADTDVEIRHRGTRERKLEPEEVYSARCRALAGDRHQQIADEHGVSQSTITRVAQGRTYRNVAQPIAWDWWEPTLPASMRWMPFAVAQGRFDAARRIKVRTEPSASRPSARALFDFLDLIETREEADGTAQRRRDAIVQQWDQRIRGMFAQAGMLAEE